MEIYPTWPDMLYPLPAAHKVGTAHSHLCTPPVPLQPIKVKLLSDLLGTFDEPFQWSIRGSSVPLLLQLKGRVRGPSFEVDTPTLDYGIVSFGFRCVLSAGFDETSHRPADGLGRSDLTDHSYCGMCMSELGMSLRPFSTRLFLHMCAL